jgi:hypothetical protein
MVPRPGTAAVSTTAVDPDPEVDGAEVDDVEVDGWVVDGVVVVELLPDELLHAAPTMPTVASARPIPALRIPRHGLPFVLCVEVRTMITLPDLGSAPPQARRSQPRAITGERHDRIAGRTPPWPNHCIDAGPLTDQPPSTGPIGWATTLEPPRPPFGRQPGAGRARGGRDVRRGSPGRSRNRTPREDGRALRSPPPRPPP